MSNQIITLNQAGYAIRLRIKFRKQWEKKVDLDEIVAVIESNHKAGLKSRISIQKLLEMSKELNLKTSLVEILAEKVHKNKVTITDTEVIFSIL